MNLVEKLAMLRQFVASSWTESDLTDCLKQCAYNVELAAEKLMTGQYSRKTKKRRQSWFSGKSTSTNSSSSPPNSATSAAASSTTTTKKIHKITPASSTMARRPKRKAPPSSVHEEIVILDDDDETTDSSSRNLASTVFANNHPQQSLSQSHEWKLCNRWVSDGVCLRSHSRTSYQEPLAVAASFTKQGSPMLSFRGKAIEGRLAENLAAMLAPLLKPPATTASGPRSNNKKAAMIDYAPPLIRLECHALMEDSACSMGSHIPLSLTVWIVDAQRFFQLFDHNSSHATQNNHHQNTIRNAFLEKQRPQKHSPLARAAWDLLQWAEYGDTPEFSVNNKYSPDDLVVKEEAQEEDTDPSSVEELAETDFEAASVASTDQGNAWSRSVAQPDPEWAQSLPEAADPVGFTDQLSLRPYQKQALFWMRSREVDGAAREELQDQLALLSELAQQRTAHIPQSQEYPNSYDQAGRDPIVCDRGPVRLVTEEARQRVTTLTGQVDSLSHPLWKTRYLASVDGSEARVFYVNELMGVATYHTPPVPTPCSGGILADGT